MENRAEPVLPPLSRPPRARRRWLLTVLAFSLLCGGAVWHYQSRLIGLGAQWYLRRTAAQEERSGDLTRRRATIARVHRRLLIAAPPDAYVPELYDLLTLLSARVASGEISLSWSAYIYTSHLRDIVAARPRGVPRLSLAQLRDVVQKQVDFFTLRKRPDQDGVRLGDLFGDGPGESYTVEQIEKAHREGRDLSVEEDWPQFRGG